MSLVPTTDSLPRIRIVSESSVDLPREVGGCLAALFSHGSPVTAMCVRYCVAIVSPYATRYFVKYRSLLAILAVRSTVTVLHSPEMYDYIRLHPRRMQCWGRPSKGQYSCCYATVL